MQETLLPGSLYIVASPGIRSVNVPVYTKGTMYPSKGMIYPQCVVKREGMEPHTCHACEDGHHVHVTWDTWAW